MTQPVLIVGAGPVGLTMAAALTHQGVAVRLIDKSPVASDKSKALVLWCRSLELFDGLNLAKTFVANGMKLNGGSIYADGNRVVHLDLTSDESPFGFPLMIPQNITERLLTDHLAKAGINIERQVELVTFEESANAVRCTLRNSQGIEQMVETPFLIGCDGAHSTVRHTMGAEFTGSTEPNTWMLADVHIDGPLARDEVSVYWHAKGVVAFFPIDARRTRMIADMGPTKDSTLPEELSLADAQSTVEQRGPSGLTLADPVWLAYFHINERKVSNYRRGRILLSGDAAHIHSPAGGQGMNTGMQDAFNAAWKIALILRGQGRPEPLLESYSQERSTVGDEVLKNAERFTKVATLNLPIQRWLRNHIAPILGALPAFRDKIRNDWFELSINYRRSHLSKDAGTWDHGLRAGDRMCDAPIILNSNSKVSSLFSLLDSTRHTLLLFPATDTPQEANELLATSAAASKAFPDIFNTLLFMKSGTKSDEKRVSCCVDIHNRLHEKLGVTSAMLVLIRPDGYIGFKSKIADGNDLVSFMGTYLQTAKQTFVCET